MWTDEIRNQLIADRGSVQRIAALPQEVKDLYKTVWEIKQKAIIDQASDRGAYICQSQSLNIHMADPNTAKLTSMHFYAWKKGLKTGMYYLRTLPKADAIQFTVAVDPVTNSKKVSNATATAVTASTGSSKSVMNSGTAGLLTAAEPECESCSA